MLFTIDGEPMRFRKLIRLIKNRIFLRPLSEGLKSQSSAAEKPVSADIKENEAFLRQSFSGFCDIVFRPFRFGKNRQLKGLLVYIDGLSDRRILNQDILNPLLKEEDLTYGKLTLDSLENIVAVTEMTEERNLDTAVNKILSGETAFFVDGMAVSFVFNTKGWKSRSLQEPENERVIRGPRQGFVETLRTNTALIRRIIKSTDLKTETFIIGEKTKTEVVIMYLESLVNKGVLEILRKRLSSIKTDGILNVSYLEEFLEESPMSPFPQIMYTERTDRTVANILEGRIAVLVEGAPFALLVPSIFVQFFQSPDDYYNRPIFASLTRIFRIIGFFVATTLPAIYVAVTTFHYEMIPSKLLIPIAQSRAGLPFSPLTETLLMEATVEILREASIRLPGTIGQTIGIVGALVIGDAAVKANLVSPVLVIVLAITILGSFTVPNYNASLSPRIMRFPIIILAGYL
jgi:hypothetical protein